MTPFSSLHPIYDWGGYLRMTCPSIPFLMPCLHTGSFSHLGVICLLPSISRPIYPCIRFLLRHFPASPSPATPAALAFAKISVNVAIICFRATVFQHHRYCRLPPPLYPVSLLQTSSISLNATHYATVSYILSRYTSRDWLPDSLRTFAIALL